MPVVPRLPRAAGGDVRSHRSAFAGGAAGARARRALKTRGLKPADINPDEMDDVIMRLFNELRRQLSQMEKKEAVDLESADRERHARILASLERTMERLAQIEAARVAARKSQVGKQDGNAVEALQREVTRIITIERERRGARNADTGTGSRAI